MNANFLKAIICLQVLFSLVSCSNDDEFLPEHKTKNRDIISFNITSDRPTRTTLLNSTYDINRFLVCARLSGAKTDYFNNDYIEFKTTSKIWENYMGERFWPNDGEALDFIACTSSDPNSYLNPYKNNIPSISDCRYFEWKHGLGGGILIFNQKINTLEMYDLCYAKKLNVIKPKDGTSTSVNLHFKHALAQVGISAKIINPSLRIQVKEVSLINLIPQGNFYFPDVSTDEENISDSQQCFWQTQTITPITSPVSDVRNYSNGDISGSKLGQVLNMNKSLNGFEENTIDLTMEDPVIGERRSFLVIPSHCRGASFNYEAFDNDQIPTINDKSLDSNTKRTGIRIKCKIWNIADINKGYQDSDIQIFGNPTVDEGYADIYIPVSFLWEPGKKYTYTITFGQGNAGYDAKGKPTIVKVDWKVDSKDWIEGLPELKPIAY